MLGISRLGSVELGQRSGVILLPLKGLLAPVLPQGGLEQQATWHLLGRTLVNNKTSPKNSHCKSQRHTGNSNLMGSVIPATKRHSEIREVGP